MRVSRLVAALSVSVLPLRAVVAQSTTLVAAVADARTGRPLPDAEVVLLELHRLARTDWLGEARIADIPVGRHRVRVRKLGYAAADLDLLFRGDTMGPVFMLEAVPATLDTVRVTAARPPIRLQPFETRRRRLGIGRFLTDSQLAREWDRPIGLVAMMHFPGLQLLTGTDGRQHLVSTRSSCGGESTQHGAPPPRLAGGGMHGAGDAGGEGGGSMIGSCNNGACPVKVFLDDMDLAEQDFDIVRTWDLAGVEYYTGASMPAEYRVRGSACGVLLLWSRW